MSKGIKFLVVAAGLAWTPMQAAAQGWGITAIGVAEFDDQETSVLLAGLSTGPRGEGLRPLFGVQVSHVSFDAGTRSVSVTSFRPYAGLQKGFTGGNAYATVGYAFQGRDEDLTGPVPVIGLAGDTDDGAVVSGGVEYWGTGGPIGAQALASYNLGGESLWTRGRVTTRVASLSEGGQIRLGGEVAYLTGDGYSVVQPGGVLSWHRRANGLIVGVGAGVKIADEAENATYFKAEVVLPIR